ncbi:MAG TPA: aminopeptidase P N-terminal domain-containing protein [Phycisphaerae bacterium]|nr:aminopeptidase P N-terminal domain-containing protein [Phycisphaerae bacterium]
MSRDDTLFFQKDFAAAELKERRRRVMAAVGSGIAVLVSGTEIPGFDPVRQDNDFYYLTGVEVPHAYMTMDAGTNRSILYLPPRDEKHEKSDGPTLSDEDGEFVLSRTGIDEVRPISRLVADLSGVDGELWIPRAPAEGIRQCQDTLRHYHKAILADPLDGRLSRETHLMARLAQISPRASFRNLSPIIHRLRLIKSAAEAQVMRISGNLTAKATIEAIKTTRPGIYEFQLGAVADYIFLVNGSRSGGYRPIIATAGNIWMMHYWRNNTQLRAGDLVLFDYAPDYNYYTSDIGRMWPVNGKYSPLQRELYGFVLKHHAALLDAIKPGRTKDEVLADAAAQLRPVVEATRWSKPIYKAAALNLLQSKRPLSHGVGMPVHESDEWASRPIEPGLVFAVDPELVVPEEQLYIRVEDTVLVTSTGVENLTAACPREMDAVEELMTQGGMLQNHPPVHTNPGR